MSEPTPAIDLGLTGPMHLCWMPNSDSGRLVVQRGDWTVCTLAEIELHEAGLVPASVTVYGWGDYSSPGESLLVPCRSEVEAQLVMRALLAIRGFTVPEVTP